MQIQNFSFKFFPITQRDKGRTPQLVLLTHLFLHICDTYNCDNLPHTTFCFYLTLKWSRGVPMDPKISFRALARKRKVIGRSPSLTLSNFTLRFFWWQKNLHRPCAKSANLHKLAFLGRFSKFVFPIKTQPNNFFQILLQQCNCIYNLQLWVKFQGKITSGKWFSHFWSEILCHKIEIVFGRHFVIVYPISDFYAVFWFFWITLSMARISPPNSFGKVLFWVRVHRDPPWPLMGVQKALTT